MTPMTPSGRWREISLRPTRNGLAVRTFSSARYCGACLAQKPNADDA